LRRQEVKKNVGFLTHYILSLKIINAPIFVPLAQESNYRRATEEDFNKMTKSKTKIILTPGDHDTIFERPFVENLAKILKEM
jgi:hypothetical protein